MDYASKIASLNERASAIDASIAELTDKRWKLSLGAADGNKASIKEIDELDRETTSLRRERETLMAAIAQAEHLQREHNHQVDAENRRKREVRARALADDVLTANARIDTAMVELRSLLEERSVLIRQLDKTRVLSSTLIHRLLYRHSPTAAAHAAGLRNYIGLDHVLPRQIVSLVEGNSVLRGPFHAAAPDNDSTGSQAA